MLKPTGTDMPFTTVEAFLEACKNGAARGYIIEHVTGNDVRSIRAYVRKLFPSASSPEDVALINAVKNIMQGTNND